jgi:hypothetical protein
MDNLNFQHKTLASGRWEMLTLAEQMGNIGSEVSRASYFKNKNDETKTRAAFERGLELTDLTVRHLQKLKSPTLKELCRLREVLCDYFAGDNEYNTDIKELQAYFDQFALSAALKKGR